MEIPGTKRRGRGRAWIPIGVIALAAALIVAAIRYVWLDRTATVEFSSALAQYKASGAPAVPLAFVPPPLAQERNSATLYMRAFELTSSDYSGSGSGKDARKSLSEDPRLIDPDTREISAEAWAAVANLVSENEAKIAILLEAAAFADGRYPLNYSEGWAMLMPHIRESIAASWLLLWDNRIRRRASRPEGAWARVDAILGVADALASEPVLVSQVARMKILQIALTALEEELSVSLPPPQWEAKLKGRMDPLRLRGSMACAHSFELAMHVKGLVEFFEGEPGLIRDSLATLPWYQRTLSRPRLREGAARCLERLIRLHQALSLDPEEAISVSREIRAEFQSDPMSFGFMLADYPRLFRLPLEIAVRGQLADLCLRIRRQYPDPKGLPSTIGTTPEDLLLRKPIVYERTEEGFVLRLADDADALRAKWGIDDPPEWTYPVKGDE